ncbi:hypothetical protein [Streptomyces sp. NPDC048272]|uniref:hypothetical protein n=1 Tax=Streptomyces sp. NPDC048272 TaxID=3154616 RepID=UPI0034218C7A
MPTNIGLGQIAIVLLLGLVVIAVRLTGWRERRIAELRTLIKDHREVVKDYPGGHDAQRLYAEEAERASLEIRRLQAGSGLLATIPAILAAVVGLGIAWYGTSTHSPTATMTGAAMVLLSILLFITS